MMKILFVSNLYPPSAFGGYERLCADVAALFVTRGHDVSILTSCFGSKISRFKGQRIHQALRLLVGENIYDRFSGPDYWRTSINQSNIGVSKRVLGLACPDVVFCWNLYGLDQGFLDALAETGVPIVLMLTDNWLLGMKEPVFLAEYFRTEVFGSVVLSKTKQPKDALRAMHLFSESAIFGSNFTQELYHKAGLRFKNEIVIHNGVRPFLNTSLNYRDRNELIEPNEFSILFAGRLVDLKGAHTAIEAIRILNKSKKMPIKYRLTIVGDGTDVKYLDSLRRLTARLDCAEFIIFREPVAESELFELFQAYDAYVFPSLYEPFALMLIIAMNAGIPTVASRVGGNVEIIEDGKTGLLFERGDSEDLADSLSKMAIDGPLRSRLSDQGRVISNRFGFTRMVDEMETFVRSLAIEVK